MRSVFLVLCLTTLNGCSSDNQLNDPTVAELLEADDPRVCADSNVQLTALTAVDEGYRKYVQAGGPPIELQAVSATGLDTQIHEVKCSAYINFEPTLLDYAAEDVPASNRTPIAFGVRPSLSKDSDFVVSLDITPILQWRLGAFIHNSKRRVASTTADHAGSAMHVGTPDRSTSPNEDTAENGDSEPTALYEEVRRLNFACENAGGGVSGSPDCDAAIASEEKLNRSGYCIDYTNNETLTHCDKSL